jgi:amidohydrolase
VLTTHGIEEIYGLHLTTRLGVGHVEPLAGISMAAADVLEIEIHGRGGHGASPGQVVNPIPVAAQLLVGLSGVVESVVAGSDRALLSIGQVIGGTAFNIIPDVIRMRGSLRTLRADDRIELRARLEEYVTRLVAEQRATAIVRELTCCPALVNHVDQTALVHRCASDDVGADHVAPGVPVMASDDMALFLAERPGCYFRVGCGPSSSSPPPHHSPDFDIDEAALAVAARVAASVLVTASE